MKKRRVWIGAGIAVLSVILISVLWLCTGKNRKEYETTEEVFGNPLMGYAPCAWLEEVKEDISLLYMDITWAELEPEEGQYNWEKIEKENQIERWRKEGKHIVLRFVCDIPGNEMHMDIPEWLYEKIGYAGAWYDTALGKGFAPDYNNETLLAYHTKAVKALGEHFGQDSLISFVELGSLGHWGEWHVDYSSGIRRLPKEAVRDEYVSVWADAFPNAMLLMRRPFSHAAKYGTGLYNDMTGDASETAAWLREIENGGDLSQTDEKNALSSMPDFWKTAPVGGEFTSSTSMEEMLETNLSQTVELIRESHVTFLGPNIAVSKYPEGYQTVLKNMGYRLWISEAVLSHRFGGTKLELTWENDGVAPFYKNWPVWVLVTDEDGNMVEEKEVKMELSSILPGETIQTEIYLDTKNLSELAGKQYHVSVGIVDPMTEKANVRLAMTANYEEGENFLW